MCILACRRAIGVALIRRRSARNMKELVVMGRLLWCRLVPPVTQLESQITSQIPADGTDGSGSGLCECKPEATKTSGQDEAGWMSDGSVKALDSSGVIGSCSVRTNQQEVCHNSQRQLN